MGLLSCILSWPSFSSKSTYLSQILKFETAVNEFEKTGEKVSDSIKSAVLMRSVTGNLKTWLQLRLTDSTSYSELRESILAFERSTTKWVDAMMPGGEMASGSGDTAPMEVGRVKGDGKYDKGKAKGKGKGKKGDWKGHKGHQSKGKGYGNPAKGGNSEVKGKGKGDKPKSKGKSKTDETCYHCGKKGHFARDCWSRVRQVQGQGQNATSDLSTARPPSAPSNNAAGSTAAGSTPNNVRRVQHGVSSNTPPTLFFDLQEEDSDPGKVCSRVVRVVQSSCRCENYFIGIDDGEFETCEHVEEISLVGDKRIRASTSSMTFDVGFMESYEIEETHTKNKMRLGGEVYIPGRRRECRVLQRRGVQEAEGSVFDEEVTIILDSGSDATVLPLAYSNAGVDAGQGPQLWDAQGGQMPTYGCRELCVEFLGEGGEHVIIKDKGLSAGDSQPLISYGRLLRRGWTIAIGEDNKPKLVHQKHGASIPIDFKNDSLTVKGWIRRVSYVRHVPADVPQLWTRTSSSWTTTGRGFPIKSSSGGKFVDPTDQFSVDEWPYRTTLALDDRGWNMIEFCEDLRKLDNKSEEIEKKWNRLLTVLTSEAIPPEQIGFLVSDSFQDAGAAGSSGVQREDAGVGGDAPMDDRREAEVQASMVPELPLRQELAVQDDAVVLEGIRVLPTSSAATLKAACTYLGISQGGSKVKMWNRIQAYMDKQRLEAAQQIADSR